ncbi:MAG: TIGR03560 family F420-dependent LLM class oxidoreductase [Candidatus Limnocylindria bacterium]
MIKFGILACPQYTDWPALKAVGTRVEELGYDALWTWDHLYPIWGDPAGPSFEGYLTVSAWARLTRRVRIGLMVGANTFRNPAVVAKMATTLDHISGGRAVLGLGAAWFETEHLAFGIEFPGIGERLDRLDEAAALIRAMLDGSEASARGRFYRAQGVRNDPPPLQARLPILIGGGGERKTLKTVARYADMCNIGGSVDEVRHKDTVLRRWCRELGRDEAAIERTTKGDVLVIRDSVDEARRVAAAIGRHNGGWEGPEIVGPPDLIAERLAGFVEIGFRHFYFDLPAPYDDETLVRLIREVKPMLEATPTARIQTS